MAAIVGMRTVSISPFRIKVEDARRRHILKATLQLFPEREFQRTTIREVAAAAGVAEGTIYNSFENKAALLLGQDIAGVDGRGACRLRAR